jgi:hypothetical protein
MSNLNAIMFFLQKSNMNKFNDILMYAQYFSTFFLIIKKIENINSLYIYYNLKTNIS